MNWVWPMAPAHDPFIAAHVADDLDVELADLDSLCGRADYISLHLPNTDQTNRLFNAERFAKCKRGVRIINTARGELIDEPALLGLWAENAALMRTGVRLGRILTTDAADRPGIPEAQAWPGHAHLVYKRQGLPCRRCGTPVAAGELEGRTLYWCPSCQR